MPAIAISLAIDNTKGTGIGDFIRSGSAIVQNTAVIEVQPTPQTFSANLRSLRIWPLPLKKNSSSVERAFSTNDIQIRNVTNSVNPIEYRMMDTPSHKDEYIVDVPQTRILFGQAQTQGEKLELIHWTVAWRDEILIYRYHGTMTLEIWANSYDQIDALSRKLQVRLSSAPDLLKQKGFLKLAPARLEPAENVLFEPSVGSPFVVWKQQLTYYFSFEGEESGEMSSGVPIKRIDVEMDEHVQEVLSVP